MAVSSWKETVLPSDVHLMMYVHAASVQPEGYANMPLQSPLAAAPFAPSGNRKIPVNSQSIIVGIITKFEPGMKVNRENKTATRRGSMSAAARAAGGRAVAVTMSRGRAIARWKAIGWVLE